jgi:hypothetical protein
VHVRVGAPRIAFTRGASIFASGPRTPMNDSLKSEWEIAVVLAQQPKPVLIPKSARFFDALGHHFEDAGLGEHNGFYDFLRSRTGAIIGVRYLPSTDAAQTLKRVPEGKGIIHVRDGRLRALQIVWGRDEDIDPYSVADQSFGNNLIYRAHHSGTFAIGFAVDPLSSREVESLRKVLDFGGPSGSV